MDSRNGSPNIIALIISCLAHVLLLGPAIYIVILCSQRDYSLFIWHPACLSVGCGLLMAEAILGVSGEVLIGSKVSRAGRIKLHWLLHVLGCALLVVGFATVVANKVKNNANHFTSDHGKIGLTAFIVSGVVALGGVLTLFTGLLPPKVTLSVTKIIHVFGGILAMILLYAALITGVYRGWWQGTSTGRSLCVAAYVIGGFLVLVKPLYATFMKIRLCFT